MITHDLSTEKISKIIPGLLNYFESSAKIPAGNLTHIDSFLIIVKQLKICITKTIHFSWNNLYVEQRKGHSNFFCFTLYIMQVLKMP